jgi:hypothetical protein
LVGCTSSAAEALGLGSVIAATVVRSKILNLFAGAIESLLEITIL